MDTGVLNVLPVQATLIPKILLKLLLNKAHYRQPARVWEERVQSEMRGHSIGKGPRLARTWGGQGDLFLWLQLKTSEEIGRVSGNTGHFGCMDTRNRPHLLGRAGAEQTSPVTDPLVFIE